MTIRKQTASYNLKSLQRQVGGTICELKKIALPPSTNDLMALF